MTATTRVPLHLPAALVETVEREAAGADRDETIALLLLAGLPSVIADAVAAGLDGSTQRSRGVPVSTRPPAALAMEPAP